MKLLEIGVLAFVSCVAAPPLAFAQDNPAPAEAPTQPDKGPQAGTEPGGAGSTGWTGGTGGSQIGTSQDESTSGGGAKPKGEVEQPETVQGANPSTSQ